MSDPKNAVVRLKIVKYIKRLNFLQKSLSLADVDMSKNIPCR